GMVPSCTAQKVRDGSRSQCANNLKQIGLGLHNFEGTFKRQPPLFGGGTDVSGKPVAKLSTKFPHVNGAATVFLLPYIEQDNMWKLMMITSSTPNAYVPSYPPSPNQANQKVVPTYSCPTDPGMRDGIQEGSGLGGTSYVANGQLFGSTDPATGLPLDKSP